MRGTRVYWRIRVLVKLLASSSRKQEVRVTKVRKNNRGVLLVFVFSDKISVVQAGPELTM